MFHGTTREEKPGRATVAPVEAATPRGGAATASRPTGRRSGRIHGAKKQSPLARHRGPYRKPTQVGGMRNLRRSREPAQRNSAKCARNFGRSAAPRGRETGFGERHKAVPGDCLSKTQAYANRQRDVCGLTPARCRKVKRGCHRKRSIESKPR